MSGYSTYIWGADAIFYDAEFAKSLKNHLVWWRMSYRYVSIWRNLHIDGFEGYLWSPRLPRPTGEHRRVFFTYDMKAQVALNNVTMGKIGELYR